MATFTLNANERAIITSWLFEAQGYLDNAVNDQGITARQALSATPGLNVLTWIRSNANGGDADSWNECAMVWWIRISDGVNITPPNRPPERLTWDVILAGWADSIDRAFVRVSETARNANTVPLTSEAGVVSTMPAGTNLIHQRSLFDKVRGVLT